MDGQFDALPGIRDRLAARQGPCLRQGEGHAAAIVPAFANENRAPRGAIRNLAPEPDQKVELIDWLAR
jgi:hypothetical protein